MIKDRPASIVTVIGSALVDLGNGDLALTLYSYEEGSIGFRINPNSIRIICIIRQQLEEAEAHLKQG